MCPASVEWDRPEGWAQTPAHRHCVFHSTERQRLVGLRSSENPRGRCRRWEIQAAPATYSLMGLGRVLSLREVGTVKRLMTCERAFVRYGGPDSQELFFLPH